MRVTYALIAGLAAATVQDSRMTAEQLEYTGDVFHLANEVKNKKVQDGDYIGHNWDVQHVLSGGQHWSGLGESGRAFLAKNDAHKICGVAIQGTDFKGNFIDILRDFETSQEPIEVDNNTDRSILWVHRGFRKRFNELMGPGSRSPNHRNYKDFITKCCRDGYRVVFTGHSLGGAVAWIAGQSAYYNINWSPRPSSGQRICQRNQLEVVTFGQPRVLVPGQECQRNSVPTTRFVNTKGRCMVDGVPQVPPCASFCEGAHYLQPPVNGVAQTPRFDTRLNAPSLGVPNFGLHGRKKYYANLFAGRVIPEYWSYKGECAFTGAVPNGHGSKTQADCEKLCAASTYGCVAYSLKRSVSGGTYTCTTFDKNSSTKYFTGGWDPARAIQTASGTTCYRRTVPGYEDEADEPDQWEEEADRQPDEDCTGEPGPTDTSAASSSSTRAGPGGRPSKALGSFGFTTEWSAPTAMGGGEPNQVGFGFGANWNDNGQNQGGFNAGAQWGNNDQQGGFGTGAQWGNNGQQGGFSGGAQWGNNGQQGGFSGGAQWGNNGQQGGFGFGGNWATPSAVVGAPIVEVNGLVFLESNNPGDVTGLRRRLLGGKPKSSSSSGKGPKGKDDVVCKDEKRKQIDADTGRAM